MSQSIQSQNSRRHPGLAQAEARAAAGFKPVALPALAAAVTSSAPRAKQPRRMSFNELPAILREGALID